MTAIPYLQSEPGDIVTLPNGKLARHQDVRAALRGSWKKYYKKNQSTTQRRSHRKRMDNIAYRFLSNAKHSAAKTGRACELDIYDIESVLTSNCLCCGVELSYIFGRSLHDCAHRATLDRRDNNIGYIKGNVYIICWECNRIKGAASIQRLEMILQYMRGQ